MQREEVRVMKRKIDRLDLLVVDLTESQRVDDSSFTTHNVRSGRVLSLAVPIPFSFRK